MSVPPAPDDDKRIPGYCVVCRDFHLITPIPGGRGGVCSNPSCRERLQPYEPGPRHECNTGYLRRPGHAEYRRCSCGQWLHAAEYSYWYKIDRPPQHWLREHGMDPAEFWDMNEQPGRESPFGEFYSSLSDWRSIIRWLFRRWA